MDFKPDRKIVEICKLNQFLIKTRLVCLTSKINIIFDYVILSFFLYDLNAK